MILKNTLSIATENGNLGTPLAANNLLNKNLKTSVLIINNVWLHADNTFAVTLFSETKGLKVTISTLMHVLL